MDTLIGFEGLFRESCQTFGSLKCYFIEVIEYGKQTATRILVTTRTYPELREYDPLKIGGPLYYDQRNKKFYHLTKIKDHNGKIKENGNTLEIMKDPGRPGWMEKSYYKNHSISFSHCDFPRDGVDALQCCNRTAYPYG